jgi:spermidine synthase
MSKWKRLLSHLIPIKEYEVESHISGPLQVCWENGRLALNSDKANYSYNHLEKVFKGAMRKAGVPHLQIHRVLNLGMGAGSTVKLLREDFKKDPVIKSIEADALIIQLAERFFGIQEDSKHEVLCTDALDYIEEVEETFDLIIVDLFIDNQVIQGVLSTAFISRLMYLLNKGGVIILNTLPHSGSADFKAELKALSVSYTLYHSRDNEVFLFFKA